MENYSRRVRKSTNKKFWPKIGFSQQGPSMSDLQHGVETVFGLLLANLYLQTVYQTDG